MSNPLRGEVIRLYKNVSSIFCISFLLLSFFVCSFHMKCCHWYFVSSFAGHNIAWQPSHKINQHRKKKCQIVMTMHCFGHAFLFYSFCILDGNIQKALHTSGSVWKQLSRRTKMSPILRKSKSWLSVESLWSKNSRRFTSSGNTERWRNATMNQSINQCFCHVCQAVQYICQRLNHYFLYISECLYLI